MLINLADNQLSKLGDKLFCSNYSSYLANGQFDLIIDDLSLLKDKCILKQLKSTASASGNFATLEVKAAPVNCSIKSFALVSLIYVDDYGSSGICNSRNSKFEDNCQDIELYTC